MIFGQNLERITFGSFLHADSKYVIDFVLWCWEGSQKIHLSFWQKTLVSILRVFLKSENKTNYIFEISMKKTTKYDTFRISIYHFKKKKFFSQKFEWIFWGSSWHKRKKLITYLESACKKLPNVILSKFWPKITQSP